MRVTFKNVIRMPQKLPTGGRGIYGTDRHEDQKRKTTGQTI